MKRTGLVLAFALLLVPEIARAEMSLGQVCKQLIGGQVTQCMAAAGGRWVDGNAAQQCAKLIGGQVTSCVGAIAGKDYSHDEAEACGSLIGGQVIECMRSTGRPHMDRRPAPPPPPPPAAYDRRDDRRGDYRDDRRVSRDDIRLDVQAALDSLRVNDIRGAERRLRRLLDDMR